MTVGVVIVTHNSAKTIQSAIASVLNAGVRDIIVVDSASSDATREIVNTQSCIFKQLRENKGFGAAANIGASLLSADSILFLNPDAHLLADAITKMIETLNSAESIGIVGGLLVDSRGVAEERGHGRSVGLFEMFLRHVRSNGLVAVPSSVGWVSGGALMIKRSIFQAVGGFDEKFFLYWEDVDLCRRVHSAGYDVYIDPRAKVVHERGTSSVDQIKKTALYDESATRYFQKYYPPIICYLQAILRKIYRALRPLAY